MMKTNKYIALALSLSLLTALPSCSKSTNNEAPVLSNTATTDPQVVETLKVLQSPKNGWVMRVFPSKNLLYGGFTSLVKFDDKGQVKASSELLDANEVYTSLYGIDKSSGTTLNFSTYNKAISIYAEPASSTGVSPTPLPHKGLDGDNAFQIVSVSAEKVVLRGIHTSNLAVLTPLAEGEDWSKTLAAYQAAPRSFSYPKMEITIGGKTYPSATFKNRHLIVRDADGSEASIPIAFTPKGIELYEVMKINGVEVQTLNFNGDQNAPAFVGANGQAKLIAKEVELSKLFEQLNFPMDTEKSFLGGRAKFVADKMVAYYNDKNFWASRPTLLPHFNGVSVGFNGNVVGVHVSNDWFGSTYNVSLPMDVTFTAPDQFSFKYRPDLIIKNGLNEYLTGATTVYKMQVWAAIFSNVEDEWIPGRSVAAMSIEDGNYNPRTFKVTLNNKFLPTEVTLTDTQDSQSVIKLGL